MSDGSWCWASGGPDWLFSLGLYGALAAIVGISLGVTARLKPATPAPTSNIQAWAGRVVTIVIVVFGVYSWFRTSPSVLETALYLVALAAAVIASVAISKWQRAELAGERLAAGWRQAYLAAKWGLPVVGALGLIAFIGSIVAGVVLGGPC